MKYFFPILLILLTITQIFAQRNERQAVPDTAKTIGSNLPQGVMLKGIVQSGADGTGLPGAAVLLKKGSDANTTRVAVTDAKGHFRFERVAPGNYTLQIEYLGFQPFSKPVQIELLPVDLQVLPLQESATTIEEVVIVGHTPPGEQKGDTTQFNASAFKAAPDASAQDLVQKMPGITVENGRVEAQGEAVQRILIDGKPFFGEDVEAALQNLPAEVIASIQVFDQKSDQAELSGFDDGERIRTINIVTRPEARKGEFGKVTAGYGTEDAYMAGASVNFFKNDRRLTVTGLSNNINTVSFSADPDNSGDSRTQDGLITSHALGLNYTNAWLEKVELAASYSYHHRNNYNTRLLLRDYVQATQEGQVYSEDSQDERVSGNHRFNMRLDYEIDENNRIRVRTRGNMYQNEADASFRGRTVNVEGPLNQTENKSDNRNASLDFSNNMVYSHRFPKEGRSLSFRLHNSFNNSDGERYRLALNTFYTVEDGEEALRQHTDSKGSGYSWETNLSYTEPVGQHGQVELEYEIGNRNNEADRRTYDFTEQEQSYSDLNRLLSNTSQTNYLTQETELGYRYNTEKLYFQVEAEYQHAQLLNDQQLPRLYDLERTFTSMLPSARLRYKFTESNNLEFNYDTRTNAPSVGQLQDVIDNSNPLQLRTGNPDLEQSFRNWWRVRYRSHNPDTNHNFYASLESSFESNQIANSTLIADEVVTLSDGIVLPEGAQLIRPVNVDGYWDARAYFSYGRPLQLIQSNLNLRGGIGHSRRPGVVNEEVSYVNSSNFRIGASLSSNISERIDFNISTHSSYNIVDNSLRPELNNNYFNQRTRFWYNWLLGDGFVYRTNINHQYNAGLAEGYDTNTFLWNMSIGKKLFPRDLGEVSVMVYDLLQQNNNIWRNVTELYVEDVETNVLERYFMLTFTYNIRHYSGQGDIREVEDLY
ncbi:outer membrane beta-barrel protein [Pontibacter sp. SGAir0037]|uniref:outer membrane beta-barrel protein n=1 Tax=Pontibacter sp. SGAir0037 TaxID=2571030 RepID=UPI0010CD24FB|nr:outer membrane beta-barrel protein [Pontibacter sp. SGAir0037]QCR24653.1 TonB-dependent receptor [Pontibacter sp. SGAir0037]